jgi:anti-anti-sigma regulatory factor
VKNIIIQLPSYFTDGNIEEVTQEIKGAMVDTSNIKIIFDFQQVQILDIEGLSLIINTCKKVQRLSNLEMEFHHMSLEVFTVFQVTELVDVLKNKDKNQYISFL